MEQKVYSLNTALLFLHQRYGAAAPTNVATLRRAIQKGTLKAQVQLGRAGTMILENDLIEFGKGYDVRSAIARKEAAESAEETEPALVLMKRYSPPERASADYRFTLMEGRRQWERRRNELMRQIDDLKLQLRGCEDEIKVYDDELNHI